MSFYLPLSKIALSSLAGQALSTSLYQSFAASQLSALSAAVTYSALARITETGAGTRSKQTNLKKLVAHLVAAGGTIYLTPKLTSLFFKQQTSYTQAAALTAGSLIVQLYPFGIAPWTIYHNSRPTHILAFD
ncbi:MAG: hypothetical protein KDK76_03810 [Chlamydiia bacterium]|nr:hypothetical protein [Chlamydiia bacterium]